MMKNLGWTLRRLLRNLTAPQSLGLGAVVMITAAACASDPVNPDDYTCPTPQTDDDGGGGHQNEGGGNQGGGGPGELTPQEVSAKLHGCRKMRFDALGSLLADRGVDLLTFGGSGNNCQNDANGPTCASNEYCYCANPPCVQVGGSPGNQGQCVAKPATPGFLYQSGIDAFGVPKIDSRQGEKDGHTTASAMRLFDIFIQAAPQIIANIQDPQKAPACVLQGQTHPMFDPLDGSCVEESVSCLLGTPATDDHLLLCNLIVDKANPNDPVDVQKKQYIAVASILAAAHSCE